MKNLPYVLIIASALLLLVSASYYWGSLSIFNNAEIGSIRDLLTRSRRAPTIQLELDTSTWAPGSSYPVAVNVDRVPSGDIAAYNLELKYDTQNLSVVSFDPGNVWTEQNLLLQGINERKGELALALGKGFNAELTGELVLARIVFRVENGAFGEARLETTTESAFAPSGGEDLLIPPAVVKLIQLK